MRKTTRSGSFFMILLFNIFLNFRLTIPGWILLILHFIIPQYIKWWYCLVYFGAFLLYMLIWMLILRGLGTWAGSAPPAPPIENKNPYSVKGTDLPWLQEAKQNMYSDKSNDIEIPYHESQEEEENS